MPHVIVKMLAGRSEEMKRRLAERITQDVMTVLGSDEASVSVAIEDVAPGSWTGEVYDAEIIPNWQKLYKEPGYGARP